jgi:pimeloyl-ACP methyl ester carboxylesterase
MRTILFAVVLLLQGCAFTQLREDLSEFYSNPAILTGQFVAETSTRVTRLDAPDFTDSNGRKGLWQPVSFVKEKRAGVYLLEQYDAAKVPVLFIHGAGGTPQDWRYFIGNLDRTKYQPWVYYYPTGLPINLSAEWLNNFVTALHAKYAFRQLIVTGHSMGGLVARRFITLNANGAGQDYVKLLVTFATPWAGVPMAGLGAALGRYAVPSWRDLTPDSVFLRSLHAEALPPAVRHHLFFGYRERGDAFDSDGVITVASQLDGHADNHAARIHGFKTDHSGILDDASVFKRYASVLAEGLAASPLAMRD